MTKKTKELSSNQATEIIQILKSRFEKNMKRHKEIDWERVQAKLKSNSHKLWSLYQMEESGGEPDIIDFDKKSGEFIFCDCATESPSGRRSLCYDREALDSRKENKPAGNAIDSAEQMGIELLSEDQYRQLQKLGIFDAKTSSWIKTPDEIRKLGGSLFCDFRYGKVFVYHNGAQSYYAARGYRGILKV
jgi:hypothetical protein